LTSLTDICRKGPLASGSQAVFTGRETMTSPSIIFYARWHAGFILLLLFVPTGVAMSQTCLQTPAELVSWGDR
jgi:hypothetical protein